MATQRSSVRVAVATACAVGAVSTVFAAPAQAQAAPQGSVSAQSIEGYTQPNELLLGSLMIPAIPLISISCITNTGCPD